MSQNSKPAEQSSTPPATPEPTVCKHCGEEIRLLNGDWLHSDTHSSCSDGSGNVATPAQPSPAGAAEWLKLQFPATPESKMDSQEYSHGSVVQLLDAYAEHIVAPMRSENARLTGIVK
jgi:hypothetical protein